MRSSRREISVMSFWISPAAGRTGAGGWKTEAAGALGWRTGAAAGGCGRKAMANALGNGDSRGGLATGIAGRTGGGTFAGDCGANRLVSGEGAGTRGAATTGAGG